MHLAPVTLGLVLDFVSGVSQFFDSGAVLQGNRREAVGRDPSALVPEQEIQYRGLLSLEQQRLVAAQRYVIFC